jgi:molybdate transport system substrate-binding protein
MKLTGLLGAGLAVLALLWAAPGIAADKITVFAAASLTDALNTIDGAYRDRTGVPVVTSFAASSTLARQIEAGAPAQIFMSADTKWMDYLAKKDLIDPASRTDVLGNRLALIAPAGDAVGPLAIDSRFDWGRLLGPGGRLAVGDPDHVPAGLYAKDALGHLGAWPLLEPRLARAEDVRGALALVERGEAPLGIVYVTDARVSAKVKIVGVFPEWSHAPIVYPFAIVKGMQSPAVNAYFHYLLGPQARAVYAHYGFTTP